MLFDRNEDAWANAPEEVNMFYYKDYAEATGVHVMPVEVCEDIIAEHDLYRRAFGKDLVKNISDVRARLKELQATQKNSIRGTIRGNRAKRKSLHY